MATKAFTVDSTMISEQVAKEDSHPVQNSTRGSAINSIEQSLDSQPLQNDAISELEPSTIDSLSVPSYSSVLKSNIPWTACYSNTRCEDDHSGDIHDDFSKSVNGTNIDDGQLSSLGLGEFHVMI